MLAKVLIYGTAMAILALLFTHHDRIGFALFCVALIPTYYILVRAGRHMYDD